ncbi:MULTISPECIES: helix-turn-helix domain-containing protein [Aquamicrobium]|uniref:Chromosomal replication initiation ATPase DnaA n=2 Tax=Aquamicrobium lusatiense TaxID=89772 RepID=A0A7W9S2R9_9HYPH|nr:helix-turn-helix domain-containing protein [Aquamicrobium sp.]MBB6012299.1 chromosomal replication initiation ATPase DnaA [Aquamicrobium lusatiense]MCK9551768.1 chromosomal replication initiator DnaA [Aquamicrobium sp.]
MHANMTAIPDDPIHPIVKPAPDGEPEHAFPKRRDEITLDVCECLIDIASALFSLSSKELRKPGRTSQPVARVRQIAMYVAHVVLRLSMGDVGRGFGRDRTTVVHACQTIEDLRDDPEFDRVVHMFEQIASAAFRNRLGI